MPDASIVSLQGMKIEAFEQSWSVMVRILSYPCERGSLMIRSIVMISNGKAVCVVVMGEMGGFTRVVFES